MQQTQTKTRPDYARLAATLDGSALEKKLEELTHRTPPRKQKRLADVLSPYTDKLLKLHGLGWTYRQLAEELKASGLPVSVGSLREHLTKTARNGSPAARAPAEEREPLRRWQRLETRTGCRSKCRSPGATKSGKKRG